MFLFTILIIDKHKPSFTYIFIWISKLSLAKPRFFVVKRFVLFAIYPITISLNYYLFYYDLF